MEFLIGIGVALLVSVFARIVGLDRDRAFYATVLVVVASYYLLFAVMGGSTQALIAELAAAALFVGATVLGFRRNLWWVAGGLAAHGVFDWFHGDLIANPGVPPFWPVFCMAYDVGAAAILAWLLRRSSIRAGAGPGAKDLARAR